MKRKLIFIISLVMLFLLIGARALRYEDMYSSGGVKKYFDRWTGVEWVRETRATGVSTMPEKYYNPGEGTDTDEEVLLKELKSISNRGLVLDLLWYGAVIGFSILVPYSLFKMKGNLRASREEN